MKTLQQHTTEFTCSRCGEHKTHTSPISTGYGVNDKGEKICFACCGDLDREQMQETGKAVLYLSHEQKGKAFMQCTWIYPQKGYVSNWPGTLSIPVRAIKIGSHNVAGRRFDFWFTFEGEEWHGVQYGNNTQIAHCRRLKAKQQKAA